MFKVISFEHFEIDYTFPYFATAVRAQFAGMIMNSGPNLVDPRGRLLPRSFDVLGNAFADFHYHQLSYFNCPV